MFRESAGLCIWQLHLRGMLKKRGGRGNWIPLPRGPWNRDCPHEPDGLKFHKMQAAETLPAPLRGAEIWPLSVEA